MKRSAPATERNREPIAAVLREMLPERGTVLEIASGTGEHAVHFAGRFPGLRWQPSDPDPEALASIRAWRAEAGPDNLLEPVRLDACGRDLAGRLGRRDPVRQHGPYQPWTATEGLMRGAGRLLAPGSPLILYGPYRRAGVPTAPSNEAFDESLRTRNPEWGLRDLEAVEAEAARHGLRLERVVEMPANNLTLVFRA